ncbi:MAG: fumarylacetoacetate hydrolase family protein [Rhodospirillales bacterium]|nr:fumarylacetoacetate hydrolase family protein [Rhodospirillales bacterium]
MPRFLLPPHAPTVLATATGDLVAVRRVYCVGRNYGAHAREMGGDPAREPPFFFSKPADAVTTAARIPFPPATADLHHEVELVAVVGRGGVDIPAAHALEHVFGYTVGIDLTRRDLQELARKAGRPWDMAKGFDHSAPCGVVRPATEIGHPAAGAIALEVNGEGRQSGDLGAMIWPVADVIAQLSALVALEAGDLIFTGTPAGVGPVRRGDRLLARIEGVGRLEVVVG